jgi:hypothetical protein
LDNAVDNDVKKTKAHKSSRAKRKRIGFNGNIALAWAQADGSLKPQPAL